MLNAGQRRKVEENIGLVHKVISDKVHGPYQLGMYSREDLFQIGCIGLCKAVATDQGGCFSTYAYRLIWNEICDALVSSSRKRNREMAMEVLPEMGTYQEHDNKDLQISLQNILDQAEGMVPAFMRKGIRAMFLMEKGYTSREIGDRMGVKANLVCAWVSKARKYLRELTELRQIAEEYGYGTDKAG